MNSILYPELSATSFDNAMPTIDIAGPNRMRYSDNWISLPQAIVSN